MSPPGDASAIERLQRRVDRERRARLEAEAIAEQGLRDLYAANQSLDERITERTSELEEAIRRAEVANDAKSAFLAHVGHELRTPIAGIAGMLELLDGVIVDAQSRQWIVSARESTDRLERLFDRILWFIELEDVELTSVTETTPVEAVVDRAADRWRRPCARVGQLLSAELSTPLDARVVAHEELDRALDEILDNAVQHAGPGPVTLTATPDDTYITFAVDDSGPGMDARTAATATDVLDPGGQPATRHSSGAGMGLALVHRIAAALGGRSGIATNSSGGSSVWISLPAVPR